MSEKGPSPRCQAITRSGKKCENTARFQAFLPKIAAPDLVCGRHAAPRWPVVYIEYPGEKGSQDE